MTAARYVGALDQGSTSTRFILFDRRGRMVSIAQREHRQYFPRPGWVEYDAAEIWAVARRIMPQALADAGVGAQSLAAIGVTNQRETTVVWDRRTGVPVHRAIGWQDTRTAADLPELATVMDPAEIARRTGLPLATYFSGPKLRRLLRTVPGLAERAASGDLLFGTMDSWLVWNLTGGPAGGVHLTDVTNASRTMLMNLDTLDWDPELLAVFGVPPAMLPEIRPTLGDAGLVTDPLPGVRIGAVIGDQQASLFGQTAFEAGEAKCTFGTGSFLLLNTGAEPVRSRHGLITTVAFRAEGEDAVFALEGSTAVAGALVRWCRDNLGLIRSAPEIETLAASVADNGGCYVVPAFSGLFAPHWDAAAQGLIVGLTSYVTKGHLARAVLESTAWQTRDLVDAMNADAGIPVSALIVDGGMTANNLLMQAVSDVLDIPVSRPMMAETVALGAAYAAGLTAGYWPDRRVLRGHWQRAGTWVPRITSDRRTAELTRWRRAVESARSWGRTE